MTAAIKSKKRAYYDVDQKCVKRRVFSRLENERIREIFGKVEDALIRDRYDVCGKFISQGKCRCELHTITRFIIELHSTKSISPATIRRIEDSVKGIVEFEDIIIRLDNVNNQQRVFLDLVFTQVI